MDHVIVPYSGLQLSIEDIYEAMGYGENRPDDQVNELISDMWNRVKEVVMPRFYFQIFDCEIFHDEIHIQNICFDTGKIITRSLRNSRQIAIFVATAGLEYEALVHDVKSENDCTSLFILDSIGTCIAESVGEYMEKKLQDEIGDISHTNRFSPGYCGWNIIEQQKLFKLLPSGICDVTLSDSSLMYPIKSISGFIGIGEDVITHIYSCQICKMENCFRKRTKRSRD